MHRRIAIGGLSLLSLAVASCSTQRGATAPERPSPAVRAMPLVDYVAAAGSIDLFVARASDLALSRSQSARIRTLAGELGEGHRGLAAHLSLAGRRVNALPAARLAPREGQRMAALEGQYSDAEFLRQMSQAHDQSLALHAAFAAYGSSPTLRPVAANAAQTERTHLAALRGR